MYSDELIKRSIKLYTSQNEYLEIFFTAMLYMERKGIKRITAVPS